MKSAQEETMRAVTSEWQTTTQIATALSLGVGAALGRLQRLERRARIEERKASTGLVGRPQSEWRLAAGSEDA